MHQKKYEAEFEQAEKREKQKKSMYGKKQDSNLNLKGDHMSVENQFMNEFQLRKSNDIQTIKRRKLNKQYDALTQSS